MKPVVIRYPEYLRGGLFIAGLVLMLGWMILGNQWYYFIPLCVLDLAVCFACGSRKVTFNASGISDKTMWWGWERTWDQVIQIGVANASYKMETGPYMLLTFSGGIYKSRTMGYIDWRKRNRGTAVWVPCSDELRAVVHRYYGPLDFDLSDGRTEGSIVED